MVRILKGMTWDHTRGYDPMVASSEQFSETHAAVRIVWEKRSLGAFADRSLDAMASNFDLIVIDHPHAGSAASSGLLVPFDGTGADEQLAVLAKQSCGASHASYAYGGHQWALAIDAAAPVAAYRPDLIDDIPTNWHEVIRLAEREQVIWPLLPLDALMSFFSLLANVGEPFGTGESGASSGTGRAILEEMRAVAARVPEDCFSMNPIGAFEWLACRRSHSYVPMLYGYSNYSRADFRPFPVRVSDIPTLGDSGPVGSTLGGAGIAVSSGSRHRDLALDFAFWVASADCQRNVYFRSGGQPGNVLAWNDDSCNRACNDFFRDTLDTLENATLRPRHDGYLEFQARGGDLIHAYLKGLESAPATVRAINECYDRSLTR